jgi:hypothetical protein
MLPIFLQRRPRIRWRPGAEWPIVKDEIRREYLNLEPDFAALDRELVPVFRALDQEAMRAQNAFRLGQVVLILGGLAATTLGAVQAARGGGVLEVGIVQSLVAFALGAAVVYLQQSRVQQEYFTGRLKAERLRGEYFQFLGRLAPYDERDERKRVARLRQRVREIQLEEVAA